MFYVVPRPMAGLKACWFRGWLVEGGLGDVESEAVTVCGSQLAHFGERGAKDMDRRKLCGHQGEDGEI